MTSASTAIPVSVCLWGFPGDLELELSAELLHQFFWCVKDFGILRPADAVVDVASVVTQNHEDSVRFQRIYGTVHNQGALWCGQMKVKKQAKSYPCSFLEA